MNNKGAGDNAKGGGGAGDFGKKSSNAKDGNNNQFKDDNCGYINKNANLNRALGSGEGKTNEPNPSKEKDDEPKMWPSERIAPGGLFHTPKVEYSKETSDLIKLLMEESKMTMLMRKQINYHLRNNEPLPRPQSPPINIHDDPDRNAIEILKRARNAKRKSLDKIIASGAYEMPNYRPRPDGRMPSDKAKRQLQEIMAGVRLPETTLKPKRRSATVMIDATPSAMINELLDQINERAEWLAEMEELGEGNRYRNEIRDQIAQRLRQIKALETKIQLQKEGIRYIE